MARIAATSQTLHTINISMNKGMHGSDIAAALAASPALHTIDMSMNYLGAYGPATATALLTSRTLHTIDMRHNNLGKHAQATTAVFEEHNNQYLRDLNTLIHQDDGGLPIGTPTALVDLIGSYVSAPIDYAL